MLMRLIRSLMGSSLYSTPEEPPSSPVAITRSPAVPPAERLTYAHDGLWTIHDASFLNDPHFRECYRLGAESGHRICPPADLHIEWRVQVCCWAAWHARRLGGDFVECGVSTGIVSRAVAKYTDFATHDGAFWLIDTFEGIPLNQASDQERPLASSKNARHYYDCSADVEAYFSSYPNIHVLKGRVPDVLPRVGASSVSYLHIDMNIAAPEVAATTFFWGLMRTGGVIVFDDYGSMAHRPQKRALDEFARSQKVQIFSLPTGQGLLLKS